MPSEFFTLPREIRDIIYYYLVVSEEDVTFDSESENFDFDNGAVSQLVLTHKNESRSIKYIPRAILEASEVFYRMNHFKIDGSPGITSFLNLALLDFGDGDEIVSAARTWVRTMIVCVRMASIRDFEEYSKHISPLYALRYCPKLRGLDVQISGHSCLPFAIDTFIDVAGACPELHRKLGSGFNVALSYSPEGPDGAVKADLGWLFDVSLSAAQTMKQETTDAKSTLVTALASISPIRPHPYSDKLNFERQLNGHAVIMTAYELQSRGMREQERTAQTNQDGLINMTDNLRSLDTAIEDVALLRRQWVKYTCEGIEGELWTRILTSLPI